MNGDITGLVAVIMIFGFPIAGMYTYYRVRKLRTDERLAALARGVNRARGLARKHAGFQISAAPRPFGPVW